MWRGKLLPVIILAAALASTACSRAPAGDESAVEKGKRLYSQLGCNACHSTGGTAGVGPTFKNLYGEEVTLVGGDKVVADEAYLRNSILNPDAQIVEGFSRGVMSAAVSRNQVEQNNNLDALVEYIKSLSEHEPGEPKGGE